MNAPDSGRSGGQIVDAETWRFIRFCFNFLLRAITVAVCWAGLVLIGLALNYTISLVLGALDVSESTQTIAKNVNIAYVLVLGVCITVTGMFDAARLVYASLKHRVSEEQDDETENEPNQ